MVIYINCSALEVSDLHAEKIRWLHNFTRSDPVITVDHLGKLGDEILESGLLQDGQNKIGIPWYKQLNENLFKLGGYRSLIIHI